jgi:hypothetical protein
MNASLIMEHLSKLFSLIIKENIAIILSGGKVFS